MINILDDFEVAQYCPALPQTVVVEKMDSQLIEIPSSTGLDLCERANQDLAMSTYVARLTFKGTGKDCPGQQQIFSPSTPAKSITATLSITVLHFALLPDEGYINFTPGTF